MPVLLPCRGQARNLTETPENLTQFLNIRAPARVACYFIIEFRQFYSPLLRLYLKEEAFPFRPHSLSKVGLNKSSSLLLRKILSLNTDVQCTVFKAFYIQSAFFATKEVLGLCICEGLSLFSVGNNK